MKTAQWMNPATKDTVRARVRTQKLWKFQTTLRLDITGDIPRDLPADMPIVRRLAFQALRFFNPDLS